MIRKILRIWVRFFLIARDVPSLYNKLEQSIIPLFYRDRKRFIDVMRYSIPINGSFFNTHRMMQEYVLNAYFDR